MRGSLIDRVANLEGIVVGGELALVQSLRLNDNLAVSTTSREPRTLKIVGIRHTGASVDEDQAIISAGKRTKADFHS